MSSPTIPLFLRNPRITGIVRSADVPSTYMLDRWFPMQGVDADEFESLVQVDEVHLAPFVNIDATTPRMPDDIIGIQKWSVAYIRYKKAFKESDLRVFFEAGVNDPNSLSAANARAAERKIRRYVDMLSQSIDARVEWIVANALNGNVAYNDTHVQYSVDYPGNFIGSSRKTPTTLWNDSSPTIVTDLSNWVEEVGDLTGHESWAMLTSQRVMGVMARDQGIRQLWSNFAFNPAVAEPASLDPLARQQIAGALGILGIEEVIKYGAKYTTRTESAGSVTRTLNRFIDDRDVYLLPIGKQLGRMATAPALPNNYQTGKFGWSQQMIDPWVTEVGAGLYAWIDFPAPNINWALQARVIG